MRIYLANIESVLKSLEVEIMRLGSMSPTPDILYQLACLSDEHLKFQLLHVKARIAVNHLSRYERLKIN